MEPVNIQEYEDLAFERLEPTALDYYRSGSGDEVTLRANRAAFERIRLRPRVLVNVSELSLETTALGTPVSMPIMVAPTAYHCLACAEGERDTARGAGAVGTLMVASTLATRTLEEIARGGDRTALVPALCLQRPACLGGARPAGRRGGLSSAGADGGYAAPGAGASAMCAMASGCRRICISPTSPIPPCVT